LNANAYNMSELSDFVKTKRKQLGLNQEELAEKAGVALTVIRKIEQGKENLSLSKVNQVLQMFGHVLGPINENDASRNS
jgi:y4mF family transcriptional regulator